MTINESENRGLTRRSMLAATALAGATSALAALPGGSWGAEEKVVQKGRIKQCVCGGVFHKSGLDFDQSAAMAASLGIVGMDLVGQQEWPILKKHGLIATMVAGAGSINQGLNDKSKHSQFMEDFKNNIKAAADNKWPNVIAMAGDRKGISDEEGMDNCCVILKEAVKMAEDQGVTICMELLNSRVNHPGYMCDHSDWGFELVRRVGSPRFKMLYDIYHMQVMEGDLIATIRKNIKDIGHFHTAGVPGRHEIGDNQEINYPPIMRAIAETGYDGYVAHEYTPQGNAIESLKEAIRICDV